MSHGDRILIVSWYSIHIKTRDFAVAFEKKTTMNRDRNQ